MNYKKRLRESEKNSLLRFIKVHRILFTMSETHFGRILDDNLPYQVRVYCELKSVHNTSLTPSPLCNSHPFIRDPAGGRSDNNNLLCHSAFQLFY